jgi:triosephosphate isomerase (TIM)
VELGGVNRIAPVEEWGSFIVKNTQEELKKYDPAKVEFGMYFPEIHLLEAAKAKTPGSPVKVGCQGVYRMDTAVGGNFGAFTTNRPAAAMKAAGCETTIIGHCEERNDKSGILAEAGVTDTDAVNRLLNQEIKCAIDRGLSVSVRSALRQFLGWMPALPHLPVSGRRHTQCPCRQFFLLQSGRSW